MTLGQNFVLGYRDQGGGHRVASYETYDAQAMWEAWRGLGVTLTFYVGLRYRFR